MPEDAHLYSSASQLMRSLSAACCVVCSFGAGKIAQVPFMLRFMSIVAEMTSNNTLERTVNHRGRIVLAMDCVLAEVQWRPVVGRSTSR